MPPNRLPRFTLALLLAVAACVIVGGAWLARRTETVRQPRDRTPLQDFASAVEEQTHRLERLYESHLRQITAGLEMRNVTAAGPLTERIVGIRQLSVLHGEDDRVGDQHVVATKPPRGERWPEPTLRNRHDGLPRPTVRLLENDLLGNRAEPRGWIDRPGQPLIFWERREGEKVAIVFLLDRVEISAAINGWLRAWLATDVSGVFSGVAAGGGPDRLLGSGGGVLVASGSPPAVPDRPDFLLPLRGRFGTWQLVSWDRLDTRTIYHVPTVVTAGALGTFTALLGFVIFAQQRRASVLAAQRVSFVNRVSHELRTPLTNILLNVDLAADAMEREDTASGRRLVLVQEEARRLGRLIDNVLTFSRHEQGHREFNPHACVPASVIKDVVAQFAPSFARRVLEVRLHGQVNAACLLDADGVAQILANLLSNVEKYVTGGLVEIATTLNDGMLIITVSDSGPGIPAREAERIFRPFERIGNGINEGASGTGLGLAIARDLAVSMGGALRLLPRERGASFELRLPAPPAAPPAAVSALLADDDPITLDALHASLASEGFETLLARDGREALALWEQQQPDLLCLDIMMPHIDGYEVCRRVRAVDPQVPVLFLSAKNEEIDVVVGLRLGADDFIRKPFGKHELLARIRTALRRVQAGTASSRSFAMSDLVVYPRELRAERAGTQIELSPREALILELLHRRAGQVVSRDALLDRCWGVNYFPESRTLDQHIAKLRKRIEREPAHPQIIETIRGVGYRFRLDAVPGP